MGALFDDPLASVVGLLKPKPSIAKLVSGGGHWCVERSDMANPFYCAIVEGSCLLTIRDKAPVVLQVGDFVMVPEVDDFAMSSLEPPSGGAPNKPLETGPGEFYLGKSNAPVDVRCLVGHCSFASTDRKLLVSLLPEMIHVPSRGRLVALVQMIQDETLSERAARDMVLEKLLELLLVEALRSTESTKAAPGLLRGLADAQLASALRQIHKNPGEKLSVSGLAAAAGMSRSVFFDRFHREVGSAPMEYVATWRMAVAKNMLRKGNVTIANVAQRVGYGSVSSFSMAFSRHVGKAPGAFAADLDD